MSKPLNPKPLWFLVALLAFAVPAFAWAADALIKPVPTPDMSKLPAGTAEDLRKAREAFEQIKPKLVGDDLARAYALLGSGYARVGLYDAANVAIEDAALLAPNDGRWVYAQGVLAREQKQSAAALGYFDRAFALDKEYLPIRVALASAHIEKGDIEAARSVMAEYTAKHDDQPAAYALLGEIALRQKRYAEAIDALNRAIKLDPKATQLYARLAEAYTGAGNAQAAADARGKAGNVPVQLADPLGQGLVAPSAASREAAADPFTKNIDEAAFFLSARQYDAARARLDAALKQRPNEAVLLAMYSRVEASAGNLAAAKSRADAAIAADPNNALAYLSEGVASEMSNDDAGAQRAYEKAITLKPNLPDPRQRLANLLLRTGRAQAAADQYRQLLKINPADGESWGRLVASNVASGQCAVALKDVNEGLAKRSTDNFLLQLFVRLASTCTAANAEEKRMALDYGGKLYHESDAAQIGEAYALSLAAAGKWDEAVKTQQAAMFVLVRNGVRAEVPAYRAMLTQLQAKKLPDRPWAAESGWYKPSRPLPDPKPAAAPAQPAKK